MRQSDGKKYTIMIRPYYDKEAEPVPLTAANSLTIFLAELAHLTRSIFSVFMEGMSDYYKAKEEERKGTKK